VGYCGAISLCPPPFALSTRVRRLFQVVAKEAENGQQAQTSRYQLFLSAPLEI